MSRLNQFIKEHLLPPWLVVCRVPAAKGKVAFTFDDGPHPQMTGEVLAVLKRYGAHATFFCIGENITKHSHIASELVDLGNEVGNHSMTHAEIADLSLQEYEEEVCGFANLGRGLEAGFMPHLFRPPKGVLNLNILWFSLRNGLRLILWSRDPKDYQLGTVEDILAPFRSLPLVEGDIVLLHDMNPNTPQALEVLLDDCRQRGLQAVTVSELLRAGEGR